MPDVPRNGLPSGAVFVLATTVAATTVSLAMPSVTGNTNYVNGFTITQGPSTATPTLQTVSLTGIAGSTAGMNFALQPSSSVGVTLGYMFNPPIPGSSVGGAVTLAVGSTGTNSVSVNLWGYKT